MKSADKIFKFGLNELMNVLFIPQHIQWRETGHYRALLTLCLTSL